MNWFTRTATPAEEEAVAAFMRRIAAAGVDRLPRLPDVDVLLVKAQLLRRWEAERRIQTPLDLMEPLQVVAGWPQPPCC